MPFHTRLKVIPYQLSLLAFFLLFITYTTNLSQALPVYMVLATIPFFKIPKKMDVIMFYVLFIILLYLLCGILFQDAITTIDTFLTRIYQFVILVLIYYGKGVSMKEATSTLKLCAISFVVESTIAYLLFRNGVVGTSEGIYRLVAGHQPVSGNFSIVILPLIIKGYFQERSHQNSIAAFSLLPALWVLLSGTRGYILIFFLSMMPIYCRYFYALLKFPALPLVFPLIFMGIAYAFGAGGWDSLKLLLHLEKGIGSRTGENRAALYFFLYTSLFHKFFGAGYGSTLRKIPGYLEAMRKAGATSYSYINAKGIAFHNLFGNLIVLSGLVGVALITLIFLWGCQTINCTRVASKAEKWCFLLYWIGFYIMNFFRWSCDCGIAEMFIFALVLKSYNAPLTDISLPLWSKIELRISKSPHLRHFLGSVD